MTRQAPWKELLAWRRAESPAEGKRSRQVSTVEAAEAMSVCGTWWRHSCTQGRVQQMGQELAPPTQTFVKALRFCQRGAL